MASFTMHSASNFQQIILMPQSNITHAIHAIEQRCRASYDCRPGLIFLTRLFTRSHTPIECKRQNQSDSEMQSSLSLVL